MVKQYRKPLRFKKRKLIYGQRFFWPTLLVLIISGGFFYLLFSSPIFQIKKIEITGNQKISTGEIQNLIQTQIKKRMLFFDTKSIFLARLNKIDEVILKEFPQIAETNSKRRFPDTLKIGIKERKPLAIFSDSENYFLIDRQGIIFEQVGSDYQGLKIKNLILIESPKLGQRAVEKEKLKQIFEIESKLKDELKILISEASIVSEKRLNIKTLEGWQIYFNPTKDIKNQLFNLILTLREKIPPEGWKNLEYIDLRFEGRVYYKFLN
ncbi:MAG: FtsQ-type POTRA domain-containing protein [Candidatus Nealsonbacteria bacterium]|nr:FtsQ-type POTRA domain-containing protein [Candidatus Nealsonbacteria bacterium]